ncbi:MAG: helix-turn-helix domain-containing protein, partial [Candidatus Poribacteria bacterium]
DDSIFRSDLYYRLDVIRITLPPLQKRKGDIPLLANHFLQIYCDEYRRDIEKISDEALDMLYEYDWPGNIRQLQNVIQQAVIESNGTQISIDDIDLHRRRRERSIEQEASNAIPFEIGMSLYDLEKEAILRTLNAYDGNRTKTAEILEVTSRTIRNKLHEYAVA